MKLEHILWLYRIIFVWISLVFAISVAATYDNFFTAVFKDLAYVAVFILVTVIWNGCGMAFMNIWAFRGIELGVLGGSMFWFLHKRPKKFSIWYYILILIFLPVTEMSVVSRACQHLKIEKEIFRTLTISLIVYLFNYFWQLKKPIPYTFKTGIALNSILILSF
jgi:hypothetical protein